MLILLSPRHHDSISSKRWTDVRVKCFYTHYTTIENRCSSCLTYFLLFIDLPTAPVIIFTKLDVSKIQDLTRQLCCCHRSRNLRDEINFTFTKLFPVAFLSYNFRDKLNFVLSICLPWQFVLLHHFFLPSTLYRWSLLQVQLSKLFHMVEHMQSKVRQTLNNMFVLNKNTIYNKNTICEEANEKNAKWMFHITNII